MVLNPALSDLEPLVGEWRMELHHAAFLPDPRARVTGAFRIDWIEGGAAIVMRQGDADSPSAATWIVGRDDGDDDYQVLYSDGRGVSRIYRMTLAGEQWRMWRDNTPFSQRFHADIATGGKMISGVWERSFDSGGTWEHDFNIDYIRVDS